MTRPFQRRMLDGIAYCVALDPEGRPVSAALELSTLLHRNPQAPRELLVRLGSSAARLLPPVLPGKIVCVGLNYRAHAEEMGKALPEEPLIFLKPPSAVIGGGDAVVLPPQSSEVHFEGELALVIGERTSRVSPEAAMRHVLGFTLMNDITARDIQRREARYTRAKGFDTFAPIGPTVVPGLQADQLMIETRVNGELRQQSGCDDLIFPVAELVSWISHIMTLEPGDVISTGTPSGVGPLAAGDSVEVRVAEIGTLRNPVVSST